MFLNDLYHMLDPVAFTLGPLTVRWYGLAYLVGFVLAGVVIRRYAQRWRLDLTGDDVLNVVSGIALGAIVGGRLGYVVFYGAGYYLAHPLSILALSEGGMSYHGGLLGAVVGGSLVCRRSRLSILTLCDLGACAAPIGMFLGRCANFVNGELWGKQTDLPWGVMFETGGDVFRHPTQLYEAVLEGLLLFLVLFALSRKVPPYAQGTFMGTYLVWYGVCRMLIEFVRVPDAQLGYVLGGFVTMGQLLSVPLVAAGLGLLAWARRARAPQRGHVA